MKPFNGELTQVVVTMKNLPISSLHGFMAHGDLKQIHCTQVQTAPLATG